MSFFHVISHVGNGYTSSSCLWTAVVFVYHLRRQTFEKDAEKEDIKFGCLQTSLFCSPEKECPNSVITLPSLLLFFEKAPYNFQTFENAVFIISYCLLYARHSNDNLPISHIK